MKPTDSVMREIDNKYPQGITALKFVGGDWIEFDVTKEIKDLYSHSLAEARREWVEEMRKDLQISDEILGDGGTVGILTSQRLRTYIDTQGKLNSYFDLLTGDNPERKA